MKSNNLLQFVKLRRQLTEEREKLQERLQQINEALGEMPLPALAPVQSPGPSPRLRKIGRPGRGSGQSLREHVLAVLETGPKTKEEVLAAVQKRGYKFSTTNPLNSLGVILYGKNPSFKRVDGKFSLGTDARTASTPASKAGARPRRKMSAAARKAIAEAARKRWAAAKASGKNSL